MIKNYALYAGLFFVSSVIVSGCTGMLQAKNGRGLIAGKKWLLVSMEGRAIPDSCRIHAEFKKGEDRNGYSISGFSGCNNFRADAEITDSTLKIQHVSSTRKACKTPENIMQTESRFLNALESSSIYTVSEKNLEIMDASEKGVLLFNPDK